MFLRDGVLVTSATDLTNASYCEYGFVRELDEKLGRIEPAEIPTDALLARAADLGDAHEQRVLARYRSRFGAGVVELERPDVRDWGSVQAAVAATRAALQEAAIVYQAVFATERYIGYADFIVRQPDGRYRVEDSKLARHARVTALLQLAAYAEQLRQLDIPCDDTVALVLGDGTTSEHDLADILPVYRRRVARLDAIVSERCAASEAAAWGDPKYLADGRCPRCQLAVVEHRDYLLVAGARTTQRPALAAAQCDTIDTLAATSEPVPGIAEVTWRNLRAQAILQVRAEQAQAAAPEGAVLPPPVEFREASALAALPAADPGDLFFDFEGDPYYTEGDATVWNLDYLWGWVDAAGTYSRIWAHTFAEERAALEMFVAFVEARRAEHPAMHIYHYASYERSHLLMMAARYGTCEAEIDAWLRDGLLVDLYPIVRQGFRIGSHSYSLKKLEPLYMGEEHRTEEVRSGGDSILAYISARSLCGSTDPATRAQGEAHLTDLANYNRYDCVSTLRLRDWVREQAESRGITPTNADSLEYEGGGVDTSGLVTRLIARTEAIAETDATADPGALAEADIEDETGHEARTNHEAGAGQEAKRVAYTLAAAAVDYFPREAKSYWWDHYFRCEQPLEAWESHRDVFVIDPDSVTVVEGWAKPSARAKPRRILQCTGRLTPGSRLSAGSRVFTLYDAPVPFSRARRNATGRDTRPATIVSWDETTLTVEEVGEEENPWSEAPLALTPGTPPPTKPLITAIASWAERLLSSDGETTPAWDILCRRAPRTLDGRPLTPLRDARDAAQVVAENVRRLDRSYLAVQGPPGTGKTTLAANVIRGLVADGWKIGVVAQSHAVVENLLTAVVNVGTDRAQVVKHARDEAEPTKPVFTTVSRRPTASEPSLRDYATGSTGVVIGGTAWDFTNPERVPPGSLDLLVIDEAGQFALANTIAAAVSARNLLLLGDPQQLPQVTQATHPAPVDTAALSWLIGNEDVLPRAVGTFLPTTYRMHPALTRPVSQLSYRGELIADASTSDRELTGIAPGLHAHPVPHTGNVSASEEEAEVVVNLVRRHLEASEGSPAPLWRGTRDAVPRALQASDIIVVTPYNTQLQCIREALHRAGLPDMRVGTVDKFQGQEAVVAFVSLAASSPADVPRGLDFLLLRNRLNVAISRARWSAHLVYSPGLLEGLPTSPHGMAQLAAFIRLVSADSPH